MRLYDKVTLIISMLSLSVSVFVAVKQFQPVKDSLVIESNLSFSNKHPINEIYRSNLPLQIYGDDKTLGGPFVLELTLSNNLSRAVSVKNVSIDYIINTKRNAYTPVIRNEDISNLHKIVKVDGNGVERVSYQVNLPIYMTAQMRKCLNENLKEKGFNTAFDNCYYEKGIDVFGNKIKYLKSGKSKLMIVSENESLPSVRVTITTGDGTIIERTVEFSGIMPTFL